MLGTGIEDTPLLASLEGGLRHEPRTRCAKESAGFPGVAGFILEGFHNYSKQSELFWDDDAHLSVIKNTISCLPNDKVRIVGGALHPLSVIALVKEGVDLVDTSYSYQVTERGGALCFPYDIDSKATAAADVAFELNLKDSKYADQFIPILSDCECHTCKGFTRGYIHHLLNTKELLAPVLLSIHNIHHYLRFFEHLRLCMNNGVLDSLASHIQEHRGPNIVYAVEDGDSPSSSKR